jgi:Domain of unknown function (DUF3883)
MWRPCSRTFAAAAMAAEPYVWTPRKLRAAFWVGHVLGDGGEHAAIAHASWMDLPVGGLVDLDELYAAEAALVDLGLLRLAEDGWLLPTQPLRTVCSRDDPQTDELLLGLVLEADRPLWLSTAAGEGDAVAPELIPDEVAAGLGEVISDPARREAFLLARARTVDARAFEALGNAGEEHVVGALKAQLRALGADLEAERVRRVSLISDELGYDVTAPCLDGRLRRLEVKATRSQGSAAQIVVTRNELTVGFADPDWSLVVVRISEPDGDVLGWASAADLAELLPEDRHRHGHWQSARLLIAIDSLVPGLPSA